PATEKSLFVLAEIRLQWAFVYLKFGNDFSAAWNVRQAHSITQTCQKNFPSFIPIQKTSGILEIMLGSVPEKYQWILGLLGMKGSVELGITQLKLAEEYGGSLSFEANLLNLLIDGFILQQTDTAVSGIERLHYQYPDNRLILFLGASLAIKNSMSEIAMNMLGKLKEQSEGLPIYYADYLLGEVYLHQRNYPKSIQAYESFIQRYKGENYVKDAHYKIGVAYWLSQQPKLAIPYFDKAKSIGKVATEADKHAARMLSENNLPNIKLTRVRYSTDGGYYEEAFRTLKTINQNEFVTKKEMTEFFYRQARLYHKTNNLVEAKINYLKTIELNGEENWYYAPNSCLQMGYIYSSENNGAMAREYFQKALTYKKHEYKNSIDSKAKSALGL
ncbi:MAG: tetratricopeptide repeat protein, partial [Cyclobacteriaceae bacterium]|nr:tetratricopeptide repeat protein [Cyclobacteriaceae bacterium]